MNFTGKVNKSRFGEFYTCFVKYNGVWNQMPYDEDKHVHFDLKVQDQEADNFKDEMCRLIPCVEFNDPTLWQQIKNFLTKKGGACDQCC